ncbi:MAG: DUF86 domain-containing protein [Chloroflexota bacterium]
MSHEFLDYVEDILDAMEKAELLLKDVTYEELVSDFRINFAVFRALEIVGEATKRLPLSIRKKYPDVPWKEMAGMRDRIIHNYDRVDYGIVWETVKKRIPVVKPQIARILEDFPEN